MHIIHSYMHLEIGARMSERKSNGVGYLRRNTLTSSYMESHRIIGADFKVGSLVTNELILFGIAEVLTAFSFI